MNKFRKLFEKFEDLSIIGIANIIGSGISAIFWFYLASLLGTESYGELSYLISIAGVASVLSIVGASKTITVYTAKKIDIFTSISLIAICSSVVTAISLIIIFENPSLSIYVIGYVFFNLIISDLLGQLQYKKYAKYFIIQKILLVSFAIGFYHLFGINGVILGFALSFLIFSIPTIKKIKYSKLNFKILKKRYGFMINSYGMDITRAFSGYTDKLIIGPIFGFALLGNYHLGIQFLSLLTLIPSIVMQYTLPQDSIGNSRIKLKKITVVVSVILSIIGIILMPHIIPYFFPEFLDAIIIVQIISIAVIPRTISAMIISKLLGILQSKLVIIGVGIYLGIQIPSIFILGEYFGIAGIAFALVFAEIGQCGFLIISNKYFTKNKEEINEKK
jgi:O-antigen/teichoic acid export membrane protein